MFSENLKRLRGAAGLTQATFAEALGASLRNVQNWEQGHRVPKLEMLPPIARVLGVSVDKLLVAEETPAEPAPSPKKPRGKK